MSSVGLPCWQHRAACWPGDETWVWRYMPYQRFQSLIESRELYLCRLDQQVDRNEGRWALGVEDLVFANIKDPAPLKDALEEERTRTFVNCWTRRTAEYPAMWTCYGGSNPVAITTTYGQLKASTSNVAIGGVRYFDTIRDFVAYYPGGLNTLNLAFSKRTAFGWEQEVRLVHQPSRDGVDSGIQIPISLNILNPKVCLPPGCPGQHRDNVRRLLEEQGFGFEIMESQLT